jgi:hypothetical protein
MVHGHKSEIMVYRNCKKKLGDSHLNNLVRTIFPLFQNFSTHCIFVMLIVMLEVLFNKVDKDKQI